MQTTSRWFDARIVIAKGIAQLLHTYGNKASASKAVPGCTCIWLQGLCSHKTRPTADHRLFLIQCKYFDSMGGARTGCIGLMLAGVLPVTKQAHFKCTNNSSCNTSAWALWDTAGCVELFGGAGLNWGAVTGQGPEKRV